MPMRSSAASIPAHHWGDAAIVKACLLLLRSGRVQQALGQMTMAMEGAPQNYVIVEQLVEEDVPVKRAQYDREAPRRKAQIGKPYYRPKHGLAFNEGAGRQWPRSRVLPPPIPHVPHTTHIAVQRRR